MKKIKIFSVFILTIFIPLFSVAQVMVVADGSSTPAEPYDTWANAASDVQTAINYSNSGTDVWIAGGTYNIPATITLKNGVSIYGGFHVGDVALGNRDFDGNPSILNGQDTRRVIICDGDGLDGNITAVDGITIQQGRNNSSGGGVYIKNSSPTFSNCFFISNKANNSNSGDGGAVKFQNTCTSVFDNCTFKWNIARDDGGAVDIDAGCNPIFTNCNFDTNNANDVGGAVRITNANPEFTDCTFMDNAVPATATGTTSGGGAVYVDGGSSKFTDCILTENYARYDGGAIYVRNGSPNFHGNTIKANSSGRNGGAVYVRDGTPVFHRCLVNTNESAEDGGAFYVGNGTPEFYTSLIHSNTAGTRGGGFYIDVTTGTYLNNTIYGNSATDGGGIAINSDDPIFKSCIIYGNTGNGNQVYFVAGGSDPYFYYCNVQGGNTAFAMGSGSYDVARYVNNIDADPLFVNVGANDFHITVPGSPCIGAGDPLPSTTGLSFPTDEDMDGELRVRGDVDIGAYEANSPPIIEFPSGTPNDGPVVVTISEDELDENGDPDIFDLTLFVTEPDDETVTWSILSPATNGLASVSGTSSKPWPASKAITYTITNPDYNGTDEFTIQVTDEVKTDEVVVQVIIEPINDAPTITSTPTLTVIAGKTWTYDVISEDIDNPLGDLTLTCTTKPAAMTFVDNGNGTGTLSWLTTDPDIGNHNVTLKIMDNEAEPPVNFTEQTFVVTVEINQPPQIVFSDGSINNNNPETVTMDEDGVPTAFGLTLYVSEPDNQDVTWSISSPPTHGISILSGTTGQPWPASKVINYTPNVNYVGDDEFTVHVSDGIKTDEIIIEVTIDPINDAPTFTTPAASPHAVSAKAGKPWTFNVIATDEDDDDDKITLMQSNITPDFIVTDNTNGNGTISGTPPSIQIGNTIDIIIKAADDDGDFNEITVQVTITDNFLDVPSEYATIQSAIDIAEDGVDEIRIAPGTYTENINLNGKSIKISGDGASPDEVIIDGGANGSVVTIEDGGTPEITNLTVTNGSGRTGLPGAVSYHAPATGKYGGGFFIYNSSPILNNVIVSGNNLSMNNHHGGSGAGIYIGNSNVVTIENSTIENNTSDTYRGGGICIDASSNISIGTTGKPVIIQGNSGGNYGGGIGIYDSSTGINLEEVTIQNNSANGSNGRGGGTYYHNSDVSEAGTVTVSGNTATVGANDKEEKP